ncbi:MAG: DUF3866 family protein [Clostridiales bacterium]|nr:DUF3866 family protein [Clostridiales bacterium]MCF8021204.1 DUF3866 family protein [Clostridiales bacterium]
MIRTRTVKVNKILDSRPGITELEITVDGKAARAVNYDRLTGPVKPGDKVVLNTTAVYKKLGTGGMHFVMANYTRTEKESTEEGHIMKLRYSPSQVKVLSVEEEQSPYAEIMTEANSLDGAPVIIAELHSMLAPAAAAAQMECSRDINIAYVMTDGAALPLPLSKSVCELKEKGLVQTTITCGHAFGGDLEAVTVYSALVAAKAVARADIIVVSMGPGIAGTASQYGFTGVEQGEIVNAVSVLGGNPVAVPRISFSDSRQRHYGLSHHTGTALGKVALAPCLVPLSNMNTEKLELIKKQLWESGIISKHKVEEIDCTGSIDALKQSGLSLKTMGRGIDDDPDFFLAAFAAGKMACALLD